MQHILSTTGYPSVSAREAPRSQTPDDLGEGGRCLRILVVANLYPPFHQGGYGLHCRWYCEALARRGHSIRVVTSRPQASWKPDDSAGFLDVVRELEWMPDSSSVVSLLFRNMVNRAAINRAISDFRPDVVYCHGIDGVGFQVYHTATGGRIPSLSVVGDTWLAQAWSDIARFDGWNGVATGRNSSGLKRPAKDLIGVIGRSLGLFVGEQPADFHPSVAISNYVYEALQSAGAPIDGRLVVIPPMLPEYFFTSEAEPIGRLAPRGACLRALFVGRMERLKGPDTAIEAVAKAVRGGCDVTLTIAGIEREPGLKDALQDQARELGIASRIRWIGTPTSSELISNYQQHDVFLFPSRIREGFGLVNAEAMACGLVVLGTAISGSADIIIDGVTGFTFPPDDSDRLAAHLLRLGLDRDLLESLSHNAMRMARRHHPARIVSLHESCLHQAIRIHQGQQSALVVPEIDNAG